MAALTLPLNAAGMPLPPIPGNPSLLSDISNAKDYIDRLAASKREPFFSTTSADLEVTSVVGQPNAATDAEIGAGKVYKAAVVFSHNPGGDVAPAWLANLTATVNQIARDVAHLRQKADELPILLANSQAGGPWALSLTQLSYRTVGSPHPLPLSNPEAETNSLCLLVSLLPIFI